MSSIKIVINSFCAAITFLSLFFFGFIISQEYAKNEYLLRTFQKTGNEQQRIETLTTVMIINAVLFIVRYIMLIFQ